MWGRRAKLARKWSCHSETEEVRCSVGRRNGLPAPRLQSRPSVAPAGVPAMVWHLYRAIFTDLNTNGYCLIVSRFISQTSSALAPAQLLQSKPLSLNRAAYCLPIKRIDLWPPPFKVRWLGQTGGGDCDMVGSRGCTEGLLKHDPPGEIWIRTEKIYNWF